MLILKGGVNKRKIFGSWKAVFESCLKLTERDRMLVQQHFMESSQPVEILSVMCVDYAQQSLREQAIRRGVFDHFPTVRVLTGFSASECRRLADVAEEHQLYLDLSALYQKTLPYLGGSNDLRL